MAVACVGAEDGDYQEKVQLLSMIYRSSFLVLSYTYINHFPLNLAFA